MKNPTKLPKPMANKTQEIKDFIESVFPGTKEAIDMNQCPICKKPITAFRNELSIKEYGISGMCQECQDKVFRGSDADA